MVKGNLDLKMQVPQLGLWMLIGSRARPMMTGCLRRSYGHLLGAEKHRKTREGAHMYLHSYSPSL
jgi:hypothetical protein